MADEETKDAAGEEEPEKKKKPMVLIIVLINLIAVGGLGVYLIFFHTPTVVAAPAEPAPRETEYGPLVELTPLVANLNDQHIGHYIRVAMHLEVADEETKLEVEQAIIPIRNRLVIYFSDLSTEQANSVGSRDRIREELVESINEVLGAPKVRRIFYTDFVVQ
ncbi:MAG: flagellar basal body-associated FliL family protein [Myxococcota bacterium]